MPVEQDKRYGGKSMNHMFIRTGAVPPGASQQFYDDCVVYVSTDANGADGVQLGQLYVQYDITLFNPASVPAGTEFGISSKMRINCAVVNSANPFGMADGAIYANFKDGLGITWVNSGEFHMASGTVGTFIFIIHYYGPSGTWNIGIIDIKDSSIHHWLQSQISMEILKHMPRFQRQAEHQPVPHI